MQNKDSKSYEAAEVEPRVHRRWLEAHSFAAYPDASGNRYVIMMPLPNVTGALHMGHAMDNVMQDLLIRWHRMQGDNTLWMPGTDHAGIATQAIVEKLLYETEGKTRLEIGQKELMRRIWTWKEKQEEQIIRQQQRMGCSCDWDRHRFTLDEVCSAAVRETFFRLFRDGLIYRGDRLVNLDIHLKTAVSDDEIYHQSVQGKLWHLKYPVVDPRPGEPAFVTVATTRPETMLGDTAVAIHPDPEAALKTRIDLLNEELPSLTDRERDAAREALANLEARLREILPGLVQLREMAAAGRKVLLPLAEREIPLIVDEWAKPELGTGCVKITPAHDPNDYEVWERHRDEIGIINLLAPDATLAETAGAYAGLTIERARERVLADLEVRDLVAAVEDWEMEVGFSDRSKTPIEPYLSRQWFVRMGDVEGGVLLGRGSGRELRCSGLAQAALDAVDPEWRSPSGRNLAFHPDPESYGSIYTRWLAEKRDWCISRQLWWGHRIPIWHGPLDLRRLDELEHLQRTASEDLWIWVAAPDGRQLAPDEVRSLAPAEAEDFEVQICLRHPRAEETHDEPMAALGLEQDPDVLDTWFSSALWPHSTLGWPDPAILGAGDGDHPDPLAFYYPGSCLVTGRDIITLWVARMVITGLYNLGDVPFTDCFVHATILDGKGETMSKSKGNGIDPGAIIDRYGADAMRFQICQMQTGAQYARLPAQAICPRHADLPHERELIDLGEAEHGKTRQGVDNPFTYLCPDCGQEFDVSGTMKELPRAEVISERFEDGKKFCTKLWHAGNLVVPNLDGFAFEPRTLDDLELEDRWILSRLTHTTGEVVGALEAYNPAAATSALREFVRNELCPWYLELTKPDARGGVAAAAAAQVRATVFDQTLRLLHPFLPFITEELWRRLGEVAPERGLAEALPVTELLVGASWPRPVAAWRDKDLEADFALMQEIVRCVRDLGAKHGVALSKKLAAVIRAPRESARRIERLRRQLLNRANLSRLDVGPALERPPRSAADVVGEIEVFVSGLLDPEVEVRKLTGQKVDLENLIRKGRAQLANEAFLGNAPPNVVEKERRRLEERQRELTLVEQHLEEFSS